MYKNTLRTAPLQLPDGRNAESLRLAPLFHELARLRIPGINANLGKQDLIAKYEAAVISKAEALQRNSKTKGTINQFMREAADQIGAAA
jgi:hypothetical protein